MSIHDEHVPAHRVPGPGEPDIPEIELDETVAPRPEEEAADLLRAEPDVADHRDSARAVRREP
jgi:hypothetical protein